MLVSLQDPVGLATALPLGPAANHPPARGLLKTGALRAPQLWAIRSPMEGSHEGSAKQLFTVAWEPQGSLGSTQTTGSFLD